MIKKCIPGTLTVADINGRLIGPLSLAQLQYKTADNHIDIHINQLTLDWHPSALFMGRLSVTKLWVDDINIKTQPTTIHTEKPATQASKMPINLKSLTQFKLPIELSFNNISLNKITFVDKDTHYTIDTVKLALRSNRNVLNKSSHIVIDSLLVKRQNTSLTATGQLQGNAPFPS